MSNVLIIYLLIGLAHWASHLIICPGCHAAIVGILNIALDGIVKTFGWPMDAVSYFIAAFKKPKITIEEVKDQFGGTILTKEKDESFEDFVNRAKAEILGKLEAKKEELKEKGSENE
jgi:hypothetical protein